MPEQPEDPSGGCVFALITLVTMLVITLYATKLFLILGEF